MLKKYIFFITLIISHGTNVYSMDAAPATSGGPAAPSANLPVPEAATVPAVSAVTETSAEIAAAVYAAPLESEQQSSSIKNLSYYPVTITLYFEPNGAIAAGPTIIQGGDSIDYQSSGLAAGRYWYVINLNEEGFPIQISGDIDLPEKYLITFDNENGIINLLTEEEWSKVRTQMQKEVDAINFYEDILDIIHAPTVGKWFGFRDGKSNGRQIGRSQKKLPADAQDRVPSDTQINHYMNEIIEFFNFEDETAREFFKEAYRDEFINGWGIGFQIEAK